MKKKGSLFVDVTIDLPVFLINHLNKIAEKRNVSTQVLIKNLLAEKVREEFRASYQ